MLQNWLWKYFSSIAPLIFFATSLTSLKLLDNFPHHENIHFLFPYTRTHFTTHKNSKVFFIFTFYDLCLKLLILIFISQVKVPAFLAVYFLCFNTARLLEVNWVKAKSSSWFCRFWGLLLKYFFLAFVSTREPCVVREKLRSGI